MKNIILIFLAVIGSINQLQAQEQVVGAWKASDGDSQHQLYFQNGFFFHTVYKGNQFVMTRGGSFTANGNSLNVLILFNSADTAEVHQRRSIPFEIEKNLLSLKMGEAVTKFERIDNGKAPLSGVWHITGRMGEDGKIAAIHQTGTRQTYKLLTGTKFQWVAIDPGKKQFSGTGGGTYTFKDGKYTENIEFFSRDHTRVGASLAFDGRLEDGKWHHSGLSSKGAKIYEVWSKVSAEIPSKP